MKKIVKKHPLAIRWFHWINFPVLGVMIWSGLLIYWANDVYKIGFGDKTLIKFFPQSFYDAFYIPFHLAEGMAYHFVFMWLFFLNGILYVLYTIFSGEWRWLVPNKRSWKEAWFVLLHDLHLTKQKPAQEKYNAAQRVTYTLIILMGIGSVLTGLAIYKPIQFSWLTEIFGGYKMSRIIHFALTIGYVLFFVIHIIQVILAGWNNFRAMVTGFEVIRIKGEEPVPAMPVEPVPVEPVPVIMPIEEIKTEEDDMEEDIHE
jgi:thiosulfate reductase cytochrome b subunit